MGTTLSDLGILEREDNFSNMTSAVKYFVLAGALLVIGWLLAWKTQMLKYFTAINQINTNFIFMKVVFSVSSLPILVNGLCQQAKITSSTLGGHPMVHQFQSKETSSVLSCDISNDDKFIV